MSEQLILPGLKWSDATVLVTGETGSFGKSFVSRLLDRYHPKKVIVFSRDQLKQFEMQSALEDSRDWTGTRESTRGRRRRRAVAARQRISVQDHSGR